jgi:hypothetical protein
MLDDADHCDAQGVEDVAPYRAAGRGMGHERAVAGRCGSCAARRPRVGEVVDREVKVGEGAPQRADHGLHSLGAGGVVGAEHLPVVGPCRPPWTIAARISAVCFGSRVSPQQSLAGGAGSLRPAEEPKPCRAIRTLA